MIRQCRSEHRADLERLNDSRSGVQRCCRGYQRNRNTICFFGCQYSHSVEDLHAIQQAASRTHWPFKIIPFFMFRRLLQLVCLLCLPLCSATDNQMPNKRKGVRYDCDNCDATFTLSDSTQLCENICNESAGCIGNTYCDDCMVTCVICEDETTCIDCSKEIKCTVCKAVSNVCESCYSENQSTFVCLKCNSESCDFCGRNPSVVRRNPSGFSDNVCDGCVPAHDDEERCSVMQEFLTECFNQPFPNQSRAEAENMSENLAILCTDYAFAAFLLPIDS